MTETINQSFETYIPTKSAFTYDDVYRFATNNCIGRHDYQPIVNSRPTPGKCIGALADMIGCGVTDKQPHYFPANYWHVVTAYNMTEAEYFAAVKTIVESICAQRPEDTEPYGYWEFVVNNCYAVIKEALVK